MGLQVVRFMRGEARFECGVCGQKFYEDEQRAWAVHVSGCARAHEDELVALLPSSRAPAFFRSMDPEFEEYAQRTGKWK